MESMIDALREERYIFSLLKHIFLAEPPVEFLREMGGIEAVPEEDDAGRGLNMLTGSVKRNIHHLDEFGEELAVEYARLFIGPKNPPAIPFASFYLSESGSLMSDVTIDVRKRYLDAGMAVRALYSTPDDHIGIEIEFLEYLTERVVELLDREEQEAASRFFGMREDFLKNHFSRWVPEFAEKIATATSSDFYRGAALMLKGGIGILAGEA